MLLLAVLLLSVPLLDSAAMASLLLLLVPYSLALNPALTHTHPKPALAVKPAVAQIQRVSAPPVLAAAGSGAATAPTPGGAPLTALLVGLWYAASVVCNQSSKKLLAGALGAQTLTLAQCVVASACGALILVALRLFCQLFLDGECAFAPVSITTRAQLVDTAATAAAFLGGFITLNSCVRAMHVSLVMVLRALEPLTTLALGAALFGANVPLRKAAALLPVVAGCACSAVGPFSATAAGLALAALSNVCFSLRGLLGKRLSREHGAGALESFFHLCVLGALFQAAILAVGGGAAAFAPVASAVSADAALVALNGASFYAYLQLSWVCLGRMSAVSHSVANSLRRPVTVVAALVVAPAALSPLNLVGIVLACVGGLVYGLL